VTETPLAAAQRLFAQATEALRGVAGAGSAEERVAVLRLCEGVARQLDQVTVATVAGLDRDGVFAERGYRSPTQALSDLVGWERFEAHRRTTVAEQVVARVGLDGAVLSTDWTVRIRDGLPEFIPPKWVDVEQKPRRRALPDLAATR